MDKNGILIDLSQSDRTKYGRDDFATQSSPQKVFSSVWAVESEVNNGGFSQYFLNSSCETAEFVVDAMNAIGAPRTGEICRRAIAAAFPEGLPKDAAEISSAAENFSGETEEKLEEFDDEFFAYPHNLTDLLFAYVSAHSEEFGELAKPDDA